MGQKNSLLPDSQLLAKELNLMKLIAKQNEYWVFEKPEINKQYEYWVYKNEKNNFEGLENFANEIKKQDFVGITKIFAIQRGTNTEWFTKEYLFAVIIEHPRYTLREFLIKKQAILEPNTIIQLLGQLTGAQKILGDSSQYLSLNDIFTNDGKDWLLKPFQETKPLLNKIKLILLVDTEPDGYPAPEEYEKKDIDFQKVKVFNLGMIVLQLILSNQSGNHISFRDVYTNNTFNKEILQNRINQVLTIKSFTKVFLNALQKMLEIDPQKRPTFTEVSLLLMKQESGIQSQLMKNLSVIKEIKESDSCNGSGSRQTLTDEEVSQREYINSLEKNLLQSKKKLQEEQNNEEKQISFSQAGYMAGSEGRVKKYHSNGKIKYDGEVKNGKYHGYGILYFDCFQEITIPLNYIDLREAKRYATQYEGNFQDEKIHGQGKLYFSNGETFTGDFENDQIHGTGKLEQRNKQIITGYWKYGIYQVASHQLKLRVQDKEIPIVLQTEPFTFNQESVNQNAFNFNGISKLAVDDSYLIGSKQKQTDDQLIQQSLKEERLDLSNGHFYMGQTLNSQMHGNGRIFGLKGQVQYEGQFRQGKFDGYGTLYNLNEIENKSITSEDLTNTQIQNSWVKYVGDFVGGKKHGTGRLFFFNDSVFSGGFVDDQIHGQGGFSIKFQGCVYGEWKQGRMVRRLQQ